MMVGLGCTVVEAFDGREGVRTASKEKFDLILMDISMPRMDGVEAAEEIRLSQGPNRKTPIVALTAHALDEDIMRFKRVGMKSVLIKPLVRSELETVISKYSSADVQKHDRAISNSSQSIASGELRAKAISSLKTEMPTLVGLVPSLEPDELSAKVHELLGVAAITGLKKLHAQLQKAEDLARNGQVSLAAKALDQALTMI